MNGGTKMSGKRLYEKPLLEYCGKMTEQTQEYLNDGSGPMCSVGANCQEIQ
jgi:hypothetical protein